jgi:hypothetical protein
MIRLLLVAVAIAVRGVQAEEAYVGAFRQWNQGSTIFELGSRYADITGVASGSRITYPRNFATTGLLTSVYAGSYSAEAEAHYTGSGVRSGTGRDEDFVMSLNSRQEGAKIDLLRGKVRDNQYVFAGGRTFADSEGKTALEEYGARLSVRMFPGERAQALPSRSAFFVGADFAHSYSKYVIFDAIQYNSPSFTGSGTGFSFTPIGRGLSFTNVALEIAVGGGVQIPLANSVAASIFAAPLLGWQESRDHHNLRGITFFMENGGSGLHYRAQLTTGLDRWLLRIALSGHRLYSRGTIRARGLDPVYNVLPPQRMYLHTKEWTARGSVEYRL